MNKSKSFIFAWALTTAILTANVFIKANEEQKESEQEGVSSQSTAVIDNCNVGAVLALEENTIKAVLTAENPTDSAITIDFNYIVQCMPNTSGLSRMMPMPDTRDNGTCSFTLAAGESAQKTFTISPRNEAEDLSSSGTWTFVVSRGEADMPVSGAGAPVVIRNTATITDGSAVLTTLQLTKPITLNSLQLEIM